MGTTVRHYLTTFSAKYMSGHVSANRTHYGLIVMFLVTGNVWARKMHNIKTIQTESKANLNLYQHFKGRIKFIFTEENCKTTDQT